MQRVYKPYKNAYKTYHKPPSPPTFFGRPSGPGARPSVPPAAVDVEHLALQAFQELLHQLGDHLVISDLEENRGDFMAISQRKKKGMSHGDTMKCSTSSICI